MALIDAVVCGNIRSELAFYEVVRELLHAKADGLVARIVFSTWRSEADRFPELFKTLTSVGVDIVTCDPPGPYGGSLVTQHIQLWRGLQALDDDERWVFKTRTEKAFLHTVELFRDLRMGAFSLEQLGRPRAVLDRQVALFGASLTEPFAHNDIAFLALKSDCRRLLNFDAAFDYVFNDAGYFPQEARWFLAPVMSRYPQLKRLFEVVNPHRLATAIRRAGRRGGLMEAPDALFQYLAADWALTAELFRLVDVRDHDFAPPLAYFLANRVERPLAVNWGDRLLTTSQWWLEQLTTGDQDGDPLASRVAAERADDYGGALDRLDRASLNAFADRELGPAPAAAPRYEIHPEREEALDLKGLFKSLLRRPVGAVTRDIAFQRLEEAIEQERRDFALNESTVLLGLEFEAQAREFGDEEKAFLAFLIFLAAAWARMPVGVDHACGLVFDGLVDPLHRPEAFETVHTLYDSRPDWAPGRFWYGLAHIHGYTGAVDQAFGVQLVSRAAEMGDERARRFIQDRPELFGSA